MIDELYQFIVDGVSFAADVSIPTMTDQCCKHWWDDTLKDLKAKSNYIEKLLTVYLKLYKPKL